MEFAFLGITAAVMYLLILRPQQQKSKAAAAMLAKLEEGDEIVLNSGIHGFLTGIQGDVAWVEVAPGIDLKVSRNAIAGLVAPAKEADGE
jgi:preprotein translocase subunit YajC